jgi:uncharacterized spore protein YtfJ
MKEQAIVSTDDTTTTTTVENSFFDRVIETLGSGARSETIFGAAVQNNGTTVIPVGKVRMGMGGGSGRSGEKDDIGSGGGGGLVVTPVGYIELTDEGSRFRRIRSVPTMIALFLAGGIAGILAARGLMPGGPPKRLWSLD